MSPARLAGFGGRGIGKALRKFIRSGVHLLWTNELGRAELVIPVFLLPRNVSDL